MKPSVRVVVALAVVAILTTANPAFAASGGRISGNRFSSSRSSSSPRSSSRPSSSYSPRVTAPSIPSVPRSYSTPTPRVAVPVAPVAPPRRRDYDDDDYYYNRRPSGSSVIVIPSITPVIPVAPVAPIAPAITLPSAQVAPEKQPDKEPEKRESGGNPLLWVLLLATAGVLAYILLSRSGEKSKEDTMTLAHLQVALLGSAKDIQDDLLKMAESGDTDSSEGLNNILKETTLALMRHPDMVVYTYGETFTGSPDEVEALFNKKSIEERSKVSEELITNELGRVRKQSYSASNVGDKNEFILVSLVVAAESSLNVISPKSWAETRSNLVILGSISSEELVALEIIWQPEDRDVLSQEELLTLYPNLVRI